MRRWEFIALLGGAAVSWPLAAHAQQPERVRRIGVLMGIADDVEAKARIAAFLQALRQLGWTVAETCNSITALAAVTLAGFAHMLPNRLL